MFGLVWFLLIGALAGLIANHIVKGGGDGFVGNMILGGFGAFVGAIVFRLLGLDATGSVGELVSATGGAVLLLWFINGYVRYP